MTRVFAMATASIGVAFSALAVGAASAETLTIDQVQCAGMSGFRAHWDCPIPVAEDGVRTQVDSVVKDRGQTAVWDGVKPGPLCFDAVHRSLLVRFPGAAEKIAEALAAGKTVEKAELVLPYLDEEIWPQGRVDFPSADGYRYQAVPRATPRLARRGPRPAQALDCGLRNRADLQRGGERRRLLETVRGLRYSRGPFSRTARARRGLLLPS